MDQQKIIIVKYILLGLFGLSHIVMREIIPVDGGGLSLIFVLTIPALIILSSVFAGIVYLMQKKQVDIIRQHAWFLFFVFILAYITFGMFPYA